MASSIQATQSLLQGEDHSPERQFDELPEDVRRPAWEALERQVAQAVQNHPLARGLREAVLQEACSEIALQVRGVLGAALAAFRSQRGRGAAAVPLSEAAIAKTLHTPAGGVHI